MSDNSNTRMISAYMEEASAPLFLSGFFQSPPRNFHNTQKIGIDVMRDDEDVAVVIQDLSAGARANESTLYTSKDFTPPIFHEKGPINAYNMIKRQAGQDPFQDPNYGANAAMEAFRIFRKLERKIRRSIELMASQVLQTGMLTLADSAGTTLYNLDFQPKATHVATVGTAWATDGTAGTPIPDVEALALVVQRDGKKPPKRLIFGDSAWARWLANAKVAERFRKDGLPMGALGVQSRGEGASFMGMVTIGQHELEMWLYSGWYKHPQTGVLTPYVDPDKVIMLSDGRLDLSYGAIPRIVGPDPRAMPFLPPRMSDSGLGLDLSTNAWITEDGTNLMVSAGTRPLTIPTAIDGFASLDVTP